MALALALLALAGCDRAASPGPRDGSDPRAARAAEIEGQRLREVTERYFEDYLELNPRVATALGDGQHDDRFGGDASTAWMADWLAIEQGALQALAGIDPAKLDGEDALTYEAFRHGRALNFEGFRYPVELLPVEHVNGLHLEFALLGSGHGVQPFRTTGDYENFLARMDGFVAWVDQSIANMRSGAGKDFVQPRVVVLRLIEQLRGLAVADPRQSVFWEPIENFPPGVPAADRRRLADAYAEKLARRVLPAYRRLHDYLVQEYLEQARPTVAWSELPNGAEWYAYLVRVYTSSSLTPGEVHELGLAEVARLRAQLGRMERPIEAGGHASGSPDDTDSGPEQGVVEHGSPLVGYRAIGARVEAAMPLLFGSVPRSKLELRTVERFRAGWEPAVSYRPGSADGRRAAVLYVNADASEPRPDDLMEARYLGAAVPGRHYQASVAREAEDLPRVRRFAGDPAFVEGWALYAESLGPDLGLYTDPGAAFGAVASELRRAAGLVVDTGLHSRDWTREQAVDYLRSNVPLTEAEIAADVDRWIACPGQALAAMVGELRIRELRRRAQSRLGPRFDVRAFHQAVVGGGPLPLHVLETRVERWIEAQT